MKKEIAEARLFVQSLKEDGIDEIFLDPRPKTQAQVQSVSVQVQKTALPSGSSVKDEMIALRDVAMVCVKCSELAATRKKVVFGTGNLKAKLMFVGEAPGADEDEQGLPFVGRAGQLLTKIIESIGFTRQQVFIANVLKCRPPQNRQPLPPEVENCRPYLERQIELIQPKIICALGSHAAKALLKTEASIGALRGKFHEFNGIKVLCTYHPAYLLRSPGEKIKVWEDMKIIKKELEREP